MIEFIENFHFIRPFWLLAILPLAALVWLVKNRIRNTSGWNAFIAPDLLPYLSGVNTSAAKSTLWLAILFCWLLAILGLAGPTWERAPTPIYQSQAATIYILDLSPSMLAEDIKPNRETRARQKIIDALNLQKDGLKALIAYSGEAHLVTPLTDDARTISSLVPALTPRIMPLTGSNIEMAVELAIDTLKQGNIKNGQLVLLTDGIDISAKPKLLSLLGQVNFPLHIISLGNESGAPIPIGEKGFAKDSQGNIIIAKNNRELLRDLANETRGTFSDISITDSDIAFLTETNSFEDAVTEGQERDFDQWHDKGYWFAWLLLPFVAYTFRRGVMLSLLIASPTLIALTLSLSFNSSSAFANPSNTAEQNTSTSSTSSAEPNHWQKLWQNQNQQGFASFQNNNAKKAAQEFTDPRWQAASHYRANNFNAAAKLLSNINNLSEAPLADDFYNLANAQAQARQLKEAIASYDKALALNPDMSDAIYNKNLVEELLKQQEQQQRDQQDDQDQNKDDNQSNPDDSEDNNQEKSNQDKGDESSSEQTSDKSEKRDENRNQDAESSQGESGKDSQAGQDSSEDESNNEGDKNGEPSKPDDNGELGEFSDSDSPADQADDQGTPQGDSVEKPAISGNAEEHGADQQATQAIDAFDHLTGEEKESMEQWLRQVSDDPSGLLKRKFEYQYRQRREAIKNGEWTPPENDAHTRW